MSDPTNGFTPPPPPPIVSGRGGSGGPTGPRRHSTVIVAAIAVAVLVIAGAVIGVVALNRDDTVTPVAVAVTLDGAVDAGNDPFLAAPDLTEVPAFPDTVAAVAEQSRDSMTSDTSTSTLTATGTTAMLFGGRQDAAPGLYGGSGEETVCDTEQLALYLAGDQAKAVAWSGARGIAPAQITDYLLTLTPVTLLSDTVVTNYGFAGGVATPRLSVLQAGTAVLVDSTGLPVVRCACGNPLAAPTVTNLPSAEFLGTRWETFDPALTVLVTAGSVVSSFTLVDLTTGASFDRLVGAPAASPSPVPTPPVADGPRTIVVVDSSQEGGGVVSASTDGIDWTTMLTTPVPLSGVAHGDGMTVVVGGGEAGGTTLSTQNGAQWTDPVAVPDALQKVAYGDGTWLAVGVSSTQAEGASGVIYTSQDAVTWTKVPTSTGITAAVTVQVGSIAYGQGTWQISYSARDTDGRGFGNLGVVTSTDDGQTWLPAVAPGAAPTGYAANPVSFDLAFGADEWAMVGYTIEDVVAELGAQVSQSGTSPDGTAWTVQQTQLTDTYLDTLAWAGNGEWLARGGLKGGMTGAATDHAVYTSTDLVSWTRLGSPGGLIADIAAARWPSSADGPAPSTAPGAASSSTTPPPATAPVAGACVDAGVEFRLSRETTFPTCEAMITQWRSFTATGGTETRQGDWICQLASAAEAGGCALSDTDIFFTVGPATAAATATATPTGGATTGAGASGSTVSGDLGLTVPMTRPACDGTGVVLLFAAVTPAAYAAQVQAALDANPGSSYLRTDQSCSSLNQATAEGNPIYAVYRAVGTDQAAVCAAVNAVGGTAYGKWLDNTTPPEARIDCG